MPGQQSCLSRVLFPQSVLWAVEVPLPLKDWPVIRSLGLGLPRLVSTVCILSQVGLV